MDRNMFGAWFVLQATEEQRRAIKAVVLFLELASHVGFKENMETVIVFYDSLSKHIGGFVKNLSLSFKGKEEELYKQTGDGTTCPATTLYKQAFLFGQTNLSHAKVIMPHPRFLTPQHDVMMLAQQIGTHPGVLSWDHMLGTTENILREMGRLPTEKTATV